MLNNSVKRTTKPRTFIGFGLVLTLVASSVWFVNDSSNSIVNIESEVETKSYIISAKNYSLLKEKVSALNVVPSHELAIINALTVDLSQAQLALLQQQLPIKVTTNHKVEISGGVSQQNGTWTPKSTVNTLIDASAAHNDYNFGDYVTIAFLDTGLNQLAGLDRNLYGDVKAWGTYDAMNHTFSDYDQDASGHGTHVASIAGNRGKDIDGNIYGVAPNASSVGIKAFDAEGKASYADVIRGIGWAVEYKDVLNIRVLNMSFSGVVRSHYWDDPLNQAVMKAWQSGIVVVASAGNTGPEPMTIGVPGNVPYIITVGAMTDSYTYNDVSDDKITSFSSAGPTVEGFVKPEIVAPGGHIAGLMSSDSQIVQSHEFPDGGRYYEMSGTSQAAAVVSGVVALMLTRDQSLTPDEVKCRLMDSAHAALDESGELAYSVFQQGAGMVNVADALTSTASACANQELDIADDLADLKHFSGPANINDKGNFYVEGLDDAYVWELNDSEHDIASGLDSDAILWQTNFHDNAIDWRNIASTDAILWQTSIENETFIWNPEPDFGTSAILWQTSIANHSTQINVNHWVEQQ